MAGNYPDYADLGTNIKTTFNLDVQKLNEIDVTSDSFKELLRRLYRDLNTMEIALNNKLGGYYPLKEVASGGQYFPTSIVSTTGQIVLRQEFIKVINFGALLNTATKDVLHGITIDSNTTFTFIGATTNNPTALLYEPIPNTGANAMSIRVDATKVYITTTSNMTAYTRTIVILKYLKTL